MTRCLRYYTRAYLAPMVGYTLLFGVVAAVFSQLLAVEFFDSYYQALPIVIMVLLFVMSTTLSTYNLELPLSFGARRRDLYAAILLIWIVTSLLCLALTVLTALVPEWLGWGVVAFPEFTGMDNALRTGTPIYRPAASWPMAGLFYLLSQAAGACLGRVMITHKVLGVILMILFWVLASALVVLVLILSGMDLQFGQLVPILYGVFAALTLICIVLLRHWVLQATVR